MAVTYTPQYRVHGTTTWIAGTPTTGTSTVISGLSGSTIYDVEIVASSPAGTSTSSVVEATTPSGVSESPEAYTVTTAGPIVYASETMGVADPSGPWNQFVLVTSSADPPFQISLNGGAVVGGNVVSLVYHNHTLFQHAGVTGSFDGWWYWNTATSAYVAYDVTAIALSNSTVAASSPAGTVVGTLSATMSDSSTFSGTYSVSDTTNFKIVGANLETNVANLSGTFAITVTATPTLVGEAFTTPSGQITITASSGSSPISYGTSPSVFPVPLPLSASGVAGQATSPMGWTVDFFDDFTGTFTKNTPANWYSGANQGGFTTGATYLGAPAQYGCFWSTSGWGGYGPQVDNLAAISMSGSNLIFTGTISGSTPQVGSCLMAFNTVWGYWEASIKCAVTANGSAMGGGTGLNNGLWLTGSEWPQMGEFDITESVWTTGYQTGVHIGPSSDLNPFVDAFPTLPGSGDHWYDGKYHTYGALLTPSYIAVFIDGNLGLSSNSSEVLNNLTTATNPPQATAAGSFGWNESSLNSTLNYSGNSWYLIFGLNWYQTATAAQFPVTMEVDWIRHSSLYPATGGPHV